MTVYTVFNICFNIQKLRSFKHRMNLNSSWKDIRGKTSLHFKQTLEFIPMTHMQGSK